MNDNIEVSIICNTFNHKEYIEDALRGFLKQETDFSYEILIHDDASTDGTDNVVKKYAELYPDLIKPICQRENQYSKGINITSTYQIPRAKGKYVAFCEGDDFWVSKKKLQLQYNALEDNMDVDICTHAAIIQHAKKNVNIGRIKPSKVRTIFSVDNVIEGGGGFVATNSLFIRKSLFSSTPKFRQLYPIDYSLQIFGSMRGGMLYLPNCMSVYRLYVPSSWSSKVVDDKDFRSNANNQIRMMLNTLNEETNKIYQASIDKALSNLRLTELMNQGRYSEMREGKLKDIYNEKPVIWKIKIRLKELFPSLVQIYRK